MIAATSTAQEAGSLRVMHTLPIQDVYRMLGPSPEGLSHAEAAHRLQRCGRNSIRQVKGPSLVLKFLANSTHVMALLLWLGGAIAVLAQLPQLGMAIWLVNCLNGAFSFWQEYKAEKATEALRRLLPTFARVLREGDMRHILAEELVPGDVCLLALGEHISADCRVVQEAKLRVDQSTLTGEAHPVRKTAEAVLQTDLARAELPNLVFAGTHVVAGTGKAVVFATGMETAFGQIAHLTQSLGGKTFLPTQGTLFQSGDHVHLVVLAASANHLKALLG